MLYHLEISLKNIIFILSEDLFYIYHSSIFRNKDKICHFSFQKFKYSFMSIEKKSFRKVQSFLFEYFNFFSGQKNDLQIYSINLRVLLKILFH
jgi:hypothetical protein